MLKKAKSPDEPTEDITPTNNLNSPSLYFNKIYSNL
jgi:hypothetical protein